MHLHTCTLPLLLSLSGSPSLSLSLTQIPLTPGAKDYTADIEVSVKRIHGLIADLEKEGYVSREIGQCVFYIMTTGVSILYVVTSAAVLQASERRGMFCAKYIGLCVIS